MYREQEQPNWNEIDYNKQKNILWANAMNNAALLVAAHIESQQLKYNVNYVVIKEMLERYRNDIYQLNMTKIDHDAAHNVSEEDFES